MIEPTLPWPKTTAWNGFASSPVLLAREVERREPAVAAVLLHQLPVDGLVLGQARRELADAGPAVEVLAIDDRAGARVVRDAVEPAVETCRVLEPLQPGARVRNAALLGRDVEERLGVHVLRHLG